MIEATKKIRNAFLLIAAVMLNFLYFPSVYAASLTTLSDTMTRMDGGVASNHTIKFTTPTGVALNQTITITFPSGFTIGSVAYTDIDLSYGVSTGAEADATLAATATTTSWGASFSGQVLTLTAPSSSGNITAGYKVIVEVGTNATFGTAGVNQIVNNAAAATYIISIGGTMTDTGKIAIVVANDDQVVVTASVDPSFTFTISANSSGFGALSTGSVATSSPNITLNISTNANSGYVITVKDQGSGSSAGLYNAGTGTIIGSSSATLAAGTEGYGIQAAISGSGTIAAAYNVSGNQVGGLQLSAQTLASYGSSMTGASTITVAHKTAISASSKAGSYNDIITYIATANY